MADSRPSQSSAGKEKLSGQVRRCRDRVHILITLRDNVINAVNEACAITSAVIESVEQTMNNADNTEMRNLAKELKDKYALIRQYENALEKVLEIADSDTDDDEHRTVPNSVDLERSFSARSSVTNLALCASASDIHQLTPTSPADPSHLPSTSYAAMNGTNGTNHRGGDEEGVPLIDLGSSPPQSPEYFTAESCAASLFTDVTSIDHLQIASPPPSSLRAPSPDDLLSSLPDLDFAAIESNMPSTSSNARNGSPLVQQTRFDSNILPAMAAPLNPAQLRHDCSVQTVAHESTVSFSDSTTVSHSDNLTSTDTASSAGEIFMEGIRVPSGQFTYGEDGTVRFYVRHVESPDAFYVQPLSHVTSAAFAQLEEDLIQFYDEEIHRRPLFDANDCNDDSSTKINRYGVCYLRANEYESTSPFERVLVVGWRPAAGASHLRGINRYEAQIRTIDIGAKYWVSATAVWKIDRRFCKVPALTIQCRLFDTRPREEGTATTFGRWSEEALVRFKSQCDGDRPLSGHVMNKREPYGLLVYMFRGTEKICVNGELVRHKMAKTLTNWERTTQTLQNQIQERDSSPTPDEAAMNLNVDFLCFGPEIPTLRPPAQGDTILVEVQKWFNCYRFSVNFRKGIGDYQRIENDPVYARNCYEPIEKYVGAMNTMNEVLETNDNVYRLDAGTWPKVGQLVASRFTDDDRYYRARVIDVGQQDAVAHVRYVDYGNEQWLPIELLRLLPQEYLDYPYMGMECILFGVRPIPRAASSNDLNTLSEQINNLPSGKLLLARVVKVSPRRLPAGPILSVVLTSKDQTFNVNEFVVAKDWATSDGN